MRYGKERSDRYNEPKRDYAPIRPKAFIRPFDPMGCCEQGELCAVGQQLCPNRFNPSILLLFGVPIAFLIGVLISRRDC